MSKQTLPKISKESRRKLRRYLNAEVDLSWMGSTHPDDHEGIQRRHQLAKQEFLEHMAKLEADAGMDW